MSVLMNSTKKNQRIRALTNYQKRTYIHLCQAKLQGIQVVANFNIQQNITYLTDVQLE